VPSTLPPTGATWMKRAGWRRCHGRRYAAGWMPTATPSEAMPNSKPRTGPAASGGGRGLA